MHRNLQINMASGGFLMVNVIAIGTLFLVDLTWTAFFLLVAMFVIRKFGITGGFHRYFSHRSYKTGRVFQFVLAWLGGMAGQKGALWWAAHHRHHHRHSDTHEDLHSAKLEGFYWSHLGWVLSQEYDQYDEDSIKDFSKYPELVFLNNYHFIPPVFAGFACWLIGGWPGLFWGFFVSTAILYHTTFAINSLCHMFGNRRYETGEESKNCFWLAIFTMGEGWHNNHHHYQASCRQGFFWYEFDPTWYILLCLEKLGIVWELKEPPQRLLEPAAMIKGKKAAEAAAIPAEREPAGV